MAQGMGHARRLNPTADLFPNRLLAQVSRHDIVPETEPVEHARHLGYRARLAVGQPLAGHPAPVPQRIDIIVIDGRRRLQVQHHHRNIQAADDRQHRRRKRISRDIKENQLHVVLLKQCRRRIRFGRIVDHAGIGHFDAHRADPVRDLAPVTFEPVKQSFELPPIGIQPDSKKSYLHNSVVTKHANI